MGTYLGLALRGPLAAIFPHHEGLTALRRDLHANPEIGFEAVHWVSSGAAGQRGARRMTVPRWSQKRPDRANRVDLGGVGEPLAAADPALRGLPP